MRRRQFLQVLGSGLCTYALPLEALANSQQKAHRFVFVILRGGMDGLSAVAPFGDPAYYTARESLAIKAPDKGEAFRLSQLFALHPSFRFLRNSFAEEELLVLPSLATPYRRRSHFDGQNILESGGTKPYALNSGWLNRGLSAFVASTQGLAIGQAVPLVLRGPASVASWAPSVLPGPEENLYGRLADLYQSDELLSQRLNEFLITEEKLASDGKSGARAGRHKRFALLAEAAGKLLSEPDGSQVATLELGGWDTHANQGADDGQLARGFATLDAGLEKLKQALGSFWEETVVVVMTEFGRTVRSNGTKGTDHGTASAAFVLGGAVAGGRVLGEWPGLAQQDLYQGRDLKPTLDARELLKAVFKERFLISEKDLTNSVFPDSDQVVPLKGLFR